MGIALDNMGRKASLARQHITSCSVCRLGIYQGQPMVWTRGLHLGFSHTECLSVCTWCDSQFVPDPDHPQSRICGGCAAKERFGTRGVSA